MKEEIERLKKIAQTLEPNIEENRLFRKKVVKYAEGFLENLARLPTYIDTDDFGSGILDSPISEEPIDIDEALTLLEKHVDLPGEHLGPGGNLAYIPISGLYISALADYLASVTNRYASVFFSAPGATRIERMLLRWIADEIGYPKSAAGDLTSGGSIANLMAVVTAREAHDIKTKETPKTVVYLTEQAHHSIEKALRVAGMKECVKRYIPLDQHYRMRAEGLEEAIQKDKNEGFNPWLIVATGGTTDTGAVDPLDSIADIATANQLWLHVDGAYGAAFSLCELGKKKLKGIDRSDSMIVNPHKGLFIPLGSGAVLVKEGRKLFAAHRGGASYLQDRDVLANPDEIDPADLSIELSRPFRGLRLWLPLKIFGVAPFRAALEEKLLLARYFYNEMQGVESFELGPPPDLSIVTFRYHPRRGDSDTFNRELVNTVQKDGRIFISSTMLDGRFTLRLAVLGFRTHIDTIDLAMHILQEKANEIEDNV